MWTKQSYTCALNIVVENICFSIISYISLIVDEIAYQNIIYEEDSACNAVSQVLNRTINL